MCYVCSEAGFTVLNYLDDFMGIDSASRAWQSYRYLEDVFSRLGLQESLLKAVLPAQKVTCLGVEVNTLDTTLSVDPLRLASLQPTLQLWLSKCTCTLKQLQLLVGQLMIVSKCVHPSRIFVSRILDLMHGVNAPHHHLRLNSEFRKDLHCWGRFFPLYNGVSLIPTSQWSPPDAVFSTDACLSGCAGVSSSAYFHAPFPAHVLQRCNAIHQLELLAIMVAVRLWGHLWCGQRIQVFCDNSAVVSFKFGSYQRSGVGAEIWFVTAMGQFELRAVHLASTENWVADYLSRWHLSALYREYLIDSQLLADLQDDHLTPAIFDFVVNI